MLLEMPALSLQKLLSDRHKRCHITSCACPAHIITGDYTLLYSIPQADFFRKAALFLKVALLSTYEQLPPPTPELSSIHFALLL